MSSKLALYRRAPDGSFLFTSPAEDLAINDAIELAGDMALTVVAPTVTNGDECKVLSLGNTCPNDYVPSRPSKRKHRDAAAGIDAQ